MGKIFGRGSNDAKGQIAAMLVALNRLAKEQREHINEIGLL